MAMGDRDRKTLPPTPLRLRRAKEHGDVARSPWLAPAVSLIAMPFVLLWAYSMRGDLIALAAAGLGNQPPDFAVWARLLAPVLLGPTAVIGATVALGGVGWKSPFRLEALNPLESLKRLFSKSALTGGLIALAAFAGLAMVQIFLWPAITSAVSFVPPTSIQGPPDVGTILGLSAAVGLVVGASAFVLARAEFVRQMRMTPEEFKEDVKASEGDPVIRRRWMQLRREWAQERLGDAMGRADVVIVNPTHYAVALSYRPAQLDAPVVVAKGRQEAARRIRVLAREMGVPIVPSPPLARDLYRSVRVGDPIPGRLYRAIANVLAYLARTYGYRPKK